MEFNWKWILPIIGVVLGASIRAGFVAEPFSRSGYYKGTQEEISYKKDIYYGNEEDANKYIVRTSIQSCRPNSDVKNSSRIKMNGDNGFSWVLEKVPFDNDKASGNIYFHEMDEGVNIFLPGSGFRYVGHSPVSGKLSSLTATERFGMLLPDGSENRSTATEEGLAITYEGNGGIYKKGTLETAFTDVTYRITFRHLQRYQCCLNKNLPDISRIEDGAGLFNYDDSVLKTASTDNFQCIGKTGNTGPLNTVSGIYFEVSIKLPNDPNWFKIPVMDFFKRELDVSSL